MNSEELTKKMKNVLNETLKEMVQDRELITQHDEIPEETLDGMSVLVSGEFKNCSRKEFEDLLMYKGAYQPCFIN